jgi:hypothetical protein
MSRMRHQVEIGQRFERLVVRFKHRNGWVVYCDCGQLKVVSAAELHRGKAKSCGCLKREKKLAPGVEATNYLFDKYQRQAKARGYVWELSKEQFTNLIRQACHYCGLPASNKVTRKRDTLAYNGIDRKDNHQGYVVTNATPCCSMCNRLKKAMPYSQWIEYLDRIARFREVQKRGASV